MKKRDDSIQNNKKPKISKHIFRDNIFFKKANKLYEGS